MGGWVALEVLVPDLLPESMPTHSPTLQFRAESVVPERMKEMTRCIQEQDFEGFAQLTMKDSNQFHATCLDTFPPISYLNDTSRRIIQLVHRFNTHHRQTKVTGCGGGEVQAYRGLAAGNVGSSCCATTLSPCCHPGPCCPAAEEGVGGLWDRASGLC